MNTAGMKCYNGIPVLECMTYHTFISVHPDHFGFVIGRQGNTIKQIGKDFKVFVTGTHVGPDKKKTGTPWIQIKSENCLKLEQAYKKVGDIVEEAQRRMPRNTGVNRRKSPEVPDEDTREEVEVELKEDKEGTKHYVDKHGNVYEEDGRVSGFMRYGVVYSRLDSSNQFKLLLDLDIYYIIQLNFFFYSLNNYNNSYNGFSGLEDGGEYIEDSVK